MGHTASWVLWQFSTQSRSPRVDVAKVCSKLILVIDFPLLDINFLTKAVIPEICTLYRSCSLTKNNQLTLVTNSSSYEKLKYKIDNMHMHVLYLYTCCLGATYEYRFLL